MSGPDYILDLGNGRSGGRGDMRDKPAGRQGRKAAGRSWLAIRWHCCQVYSRIYRDSEATAYEGRCPKCARPLKVPIGPQGTHARFFDAF